MIRTNVYYSDIKLTDTKVQMKQDARTVLGINSYWLHELISQELSHCL